MIGTATWVKIALAIFSVGGAAGGTYLIKGKSFVSEQPSREQSQTLTSRNHDVMNSVKNDGGNEEEKEKNSQPDSAPKNETLVTLNPETFSALTQSESSSSKADSQDSDGKSESEESKTQIPKESLDGKSSQEPTEGLSVQENTTSELTSREESSSQTSNSSDSQVDLGARDNPEQIQSDSPSTPSVSEGYNARQQKYEKVFGDDGKNPNKEITGEYILSRGEGIDNICVSIVEGVGKELEDKEECKKKVSSNLMDENVKKNSRVWLKTNIKKILEVLEVKDEKGKWFGENENIFEVNNYYGESLTCKLENKSASEREQGFFVSCNLKGVRGDISVEASSTT
ncbi:hypothetical protein MSUIS_00830 [Mycoplasma suis KI3806]|uniref:Uncharacterized protein n=1 Tax=Mycoplasma suis (strain KI_3806) TaxID=708248 RepID=F0V2V4_MYCS3|nr:hypothetical protein [Mycoplasma suis]CBZ40176.1 hypothetical protein MSUIS_00830 [Mycoplasma suis KI3806]